MKRLLKQPERRATSSAAARVSPGPINPLEVYLRPNQRRSLNGGPSDTGHQIEFLGDDDVVITTRPIRARLGETFEQAITREATQWGASISTSVV